MAAKKVVSITGGAGFIGKPLVQSHLSLGDEVRVLSRHPQKDTEGVRYFQGDLTSSTCELSQFVEGVDVLYHCAGELYDESKMEDLHVNGIKRLLLAADGRVGRWVQLSSVGAYGSCRNGTVTEETRENPIGVYEFTKTQSDQLVRETSVKGGMEYSILRPSIVFGESMTNQSLAQMCKMIQRGLFFYIGRNAVVNYVHVADVVNALMLCGQLAEAKDKTYILSDAVSLESMAASISKGMGVRPPSVRLSESIARFLSNSIGKIPGFPLTESRVNALTSRCCYDSSAIQKELGVSFQTSLEEAFYNYAASLP